MICCNGVGSILNMQMKDVLSRDQTVPHDHRQTLFSYNLKLSYMSGSRWTATCYYQLL